MIKLVVFISWGDYIMATYLRLGFRFWMISVFLGILGGCDSSTKSDLEIVNVSYDPTRELYQEINEAFGKEYLQKTGKQVQVIQSHGGSGSQARAVIDGLKADVVTLALAGDINAIAGKDLIAKDWENRLPQNSCPYVSTIVLVVRKGNPKEIKDWPDLIKPGVQVITPNPKTSGGARWNFLAAWGFVTLHQKKSEAEAQEFVRKLFQNVIKLDTGARGATESFVRRKLGDVFISWENEAILATKEFPGEGLEVIYPSISIQAEPPVTFVDRTVDERGTRQIAEEYLKFLYTESAQKIISRHGYRPNAPEFSRQIATTLPPIKMFTLREVIGNWANAQHKFFADGGIFDKIYRGRAE